MSKSRAWRAIEKVAGLNELVYALNRFGENSGLNKGEYRSVNGIGIVGKVMEGKGAWKKRLSARSLKKK
ncbi:MAG: hypothetical protein NTX71_08700 [Candidatus Aureabacteria bacterium]|nr:hypothetical protein [Candidatus Auribacterota bacterium]